MATEIQQFTADGVTTEFNFTFEVAKDGLLDVYNTLNGNEANEDNDLVNPSDYSLVYTQPNADTTTGKVVFNTAPADGDVITLLPVLNADTDIDFAAQSQLIASNLNLALARHTQPLNFNFGLYEARVLRYNLNVNQNEIAAYNNLLPPLSDGSFWRRVGSGIIDQTYTGFITDVSNTLTSYSNEIEQVTITGVTGTGPFSLSAFTTGDIRQDTLDVYKQGLKLSQATGDDYAIDGINKTITFTKALDVSDYVYVVKPLIVKSDTLMNVEGNNAVFADDTLIADKSLTNTKFVTNTMVAAKDLSNITTPSKDALKIITGSLFAIGDVLISENDPSTRGFAGTWEKIPDGLAITSTTSDHNTSTTGSDLSSITTVDNTALTLAQIPAHTHTVVANEVGSGNVSYSETGNGKMGNRTIASGSSGSGGSHTHGFSIATKKFTFWIRTA